MATVSGKVDGDKGEKKKKEGKGAKDGKGDENDASAKKKGERGASKKEDGEGKGRKSGEKGDRKEKEAEKGSKGGAKAGAKKAQKWTLPPTDNCFTPQIFWFFLFLKCHLYYILNKQKTTVQHKKSVLVFSMNIATIEVQQPSEFIELFTIHLNTGHRGTSSYFIPSLHGYLQWPKAWKIVRCLRKQPTRYLKHNYPWVHWVCCGTR